LQRSSPKGKEISEESGYGLFSGTGADRAKKNFQKSPAGTFPVIIVECLGKISKKTGRKISGRLHDLHPLMRQRDAGISRLSSILKPPFFPDPVLLVRFLGLSPPNSVY
jgi:hypothetical protein